MFLLDCEDDDPAGIAAVSAALLMTELALTRIFSVTMYYHFAFLAISIALFGLSASGVFVYVMRRRLAVDRDARAAHRRRARPRRSRPSLALAFLVRIRVGLNYSPANLALMLAIYALAALPFFTGGAVISLAFARLTDRINVLYAADLLGAAAGCLALIPLLNQLGAPGVVLTAAALSLARRRLLRAAARRPAIAIAGGWRCSAVPAARSGDGAAPFDVVDTKGHEGDRVLFSKWNSFSRVAVYDRAHGDWSLSPRITGARGESLFMDIDSAASTPILQGNGRPTPRLPSLRADGARLSPGRAARRILRARHRPRRRARPALRAGLRRAPRGRRRDQPDHRARRDARPFPRVLRRHLRRSQASPIHVDDGRSFVRRSALGYDVIQASLVDTWAATAAGAYTLTENSLYTTEAFGEYSTISPTTGILTITRWVFDGLRLVSLAQEACAARGLDAARHLAIVRFDRVATFLLKKTPFSEADVRALDRSRRRARVLGAVRARRRAARRSRRTRSKCSGPARAPTTIAG